MIPNAFDLLHKGPRGQKIRRVDENDALRKIVGRRFKLARDLSGLSQEDAAQRLDYTNSTQLSLAEKGDRLPPLAKIIKASEVYGVSIDYLTGVSDEPERDPRMADRMAAMRKVSSVMDRAAMAIVTAVLSNESSAPSIVSTKRLVSLSEAAIQSVEALRASNLSVFDQDLRGAATVLRVMDELQAAVMQSKQVLIRHDQVIETSIRTMEERIGITRPIFDQAEG